MEQAITIHPRNLEDLNVTFLSRNWDIKDFKYPSGDYAYYRGNHTVLISVSRRRPIKKYMYQGGGYIAVENEYTSL